MTAATIETDAVIIGAGPIGLFQAFELGLFEIRTEIVDALPAIGGQCIELYPDKPIYDVPGIRECSGRELADRLLDQLEPFAPRFHLGQQVVELQRKPGGGFSVATSTGTRFDTKVVVIAAGVGAFLPKPLRVEGLERFIATAPPQLHYALPASDAGWQRFAGRRVVIVGAGEQALAAANTLAAPGPQAAASVVLVHRRDAFAAAPETIDAFEALRAQGRIEVAIGQVQRFDEQQGRLVAVDVETPGHEPRRLPLDDLFVLQGLSPRLGPIADWGLALERKHVVVDTASLQSSEPGIFAVGDIVHYPGKRKLIVCGFHEATLAAFAAAAIVHPERPVQLQYTTTSPKLHALLKVNPPLD